MERFVVQQHCRDEQEHWDLMLERSESLATWQVSVGPKDWSGAVLKCRRIGDHRLEYLSYEGPLSDDRGRVQIVAAGGYVPLLVTEELWRVTLQGAELSGRLELAQVQQDQWQLSFQGEPSCE